MKRFVGVLLLLLAVLIMTGSDKQLEALLLDWGWFDSTHVEYLLSRWFGIES